MKAYLIDPFLKTITEIEHSGSLADLYAHTRCSIVEAVGLNQDNDTVYIDEEGLLKDLSKQAFFEVGGDVRSVALAGYGLVSGTTQDGNMCSPAATIDTIKGMVKFKTLDELRTQLH